jgi:hypothetical protein
MEPLALFRSWSLFVSSSGFWIHEVASAGELFTWRTLGSGQRRLPHVFSRRAASIIRVNWRMRVHEWCSLKPYCRIVEL